MGQGLALRFLSSFDHLEIWIPILVGEMRQTPLPKEFAEASAAADQTATQLPLPDPTSPSPGEDSDKEKKAKRSRSRARKKKKQNIGQDLSPEDNEPSLEIRFPKNRDK